jgi:hypothetical protein
MPEAAKTAGSVKEDFKMRITFAIAMLALLGPSSVAQARDYPVCLRVYQNFHQWYDECGYTSMPQCQMSASGRAAECIVNPWYKGPEPGQQTRRRHRGQ